MRDIIGAPAGWLARAIRTKKVSSLEVVRAHLEHIHTVNPRLNAVVFATGESALKQARAADRRNKSKSVLGPLHGVPFTAKDIFDTAGLPTTAGLRMLRSNIPDRDATVVARMRAAGAILIGKTLCPPGGADGDSWNSLHGGTRNPYDIARSPGASSSGEAAIIAAAAGAGRAGNVVRVARPSVQRVPAVAVRTSWRAERLADEDRARGTHESDDGGVAVGDVAPEHAKPGGGWKPGGVEDVLGRERHAMQRTEHIH